MKTTINHILAKGSVLGLLLFCASITSLCQPVANFTANTQAGCSPLIVNFQDQSTGSPTSWSWNFGNGNTSALQNPSATYFTPGTYTVTLTATNAAGSNTITRSQYITVYEPPTVNFTENIRSGCFPLRVQFTDLSTPGAGNNNVAWAWDFGNGITSTLQNPLAVYTTAGNFTVTLKVTNDKGCTKTISRPNHITVTPGVTSAFTNTQPTVCSAPASITFTNSSNGPPTLSYLWDFGDGSPMVATPNPVHTYASAGTYTAMLITNSSAGCEDTARSTAIIIGGYNTIFTAPASACVNETISFTNTSTPVPASAVWNFGDGGTATTINATHSYAAPGNYIVRLYNTYAACTDSTLQSITINPRPVADFTAPVTSRCQPPLTVDFQDISTGGAVGWQWDFGDGSPASTLQNPSHTYTSYGNFTITLIATNAFGCTDTLVRTDYIIIQRPVISIPLFPVRGCIPHSISPVATITTTDVVTSYLWDFGDGFTSNAATPTHTYTVQGTYIVKLYITTSSGCTDSLVVPNAVRVGSKPVADFTATPTPVCARKTVYFTDLSTPATVDEWLWDFGDGVTSILQNPPHVYTDTGCFDVRLIAYNNGCPDTLIRSDYICVLPPIARFLATPDCNNRLRFTFTDQSIAPLTWEWDFGDGSPRTTIQNPVHIYPAYGIYPVMLIVTNGGCIDTLIQNINAVNENSVFDADRLTACKTADISFHVSNINPANLVSYAWDFGDGGTATVTAPDVTHTYTNSGTYTVTLVTTDVNGCTNTVTRTNYIRINGPVADFSATNTNGCTGLTTTFTDASLTDGTNPLASWQWDFGDGIVQSFSSPPFTHTYNTIGTFSVKLVVTDASGCKDSLTRTNIIVTTDPVPNFLGDTLSCPGASVGFINTSYPGGFSSAWDFGDGNTSTTLSPNHTYAATGVYTVKLTILDPNGCADSITKIAFIRIDRPAASFNMNDSISSCIPFEVQFNNTSTFYSSILWDFGPGEGTSTLPSPVHYYTLPGSYPVTLTVTSPGGCTNQTTGTVIVSDTIGSRINYMPISGCKPLPVTLNSFTTGQMASYFWDFGDGYTQTTFVPDASHIYTSWGNFLPKVIMEDPSGCLIPLTGLDTVLVTGANTKFGLDKRLFCDSGTVHFTDSTTFNDPIVNYTWNFGDGNTSNLQNPVHQYTSPGIYTVSLATLTQIGCRDTITYRDTIKVVQRPLIDIGGDTVVCVNSALLHTGLFIQPDTSVVTWQWNFPNGNNATIQNPPQQVYTTPGTFTVTAYAMNSTGCRDTTRQNILVNPLPTINIPGQMTIQAGFPVTIPATYSPNTISWIWSPSTGLSCGNCPQPEAGPKFNTLYQVYFTDNNGCSNLGQTMVTVICKNANLFIPNTFTPNGDGSNDVFYPRGKGLERVRLLRIFNRWGEVVFEKRDFPINNASFGWDGTYKGNKPKADVYVYQAEVFCDNGDIIRLNGNIALVL